MKVRQFNIRHLLLIGVTVLTLIELTQSRPSRAQEADLLRASDPPPNAIWVDSLDLRKMVQRQQTPRAGRSLRNNPMTLNGVVYQHGIGTLSISEFVIDLKGQATRFISMVGLDDEVKTRKGSASFEVWVDNKKAADTGVMRSGEPPKLISVDLTGARYLELFFDDGGDVSTDDNGDWAGAMIMLKSGATAKPEAYTAPVETAPIIATNSSMQPRINGPRITGATPGKPFLFLIPATGEGPLTFAAKNLPAGLTLDAKTGTPGGLRRSGLATMTRTTISARSMMASNRCIQPMSRRYIFACGQQWEPRRGSNMNSNARPKFLPLKCTGWMTADSASFRQGGASCTKMVRSGSRSSIVNHTALRKTPSIE